MAIFSEHEMSRRHAALRARMAAQELSAVVATSYPAFYYLTGVPIHAFGRPMAVIVPGASEPAIVESIIEVEHTRAHATIADIRTYYDYHLEPVFAAPQPPWESLVAHLRTILAERGLAQARIGFEDAHLPVGHFRRLETALPQVKWVGASHLLDRLRTVLSDEELALVRAADAVADLGQALLIDLAKPGRLAAEIVRTVRDAMIQAIGREHPDKPFHLHVDPGLGSGAKAAGHSEWTLWNLGDRVQRNQLLTTVVSVWLWGYWGNVERTVYGGEPDARVRRAFDIMVEANETTIAMIAPGMRLADVDRTAKAVLARHGYHTRSGSGCGRGIVSYEGNARELPMDVRLYADIVLEPGMAFSLEPDLLEPGVGTFRHCNTLIVTADGCEVDSRLPRGPIYV
jgi:Xaa-Pro aminopeptidase